MAGHSKWATTKHKKAANDAKRGKLFAKLVKGVEVAARLGGSDPGGNPALYDAIQKAKKNSVPNDNIDRAIKRGSGEGADGVSYDTIMYEAYGPEGVAILIECLTDNRNRAISDVRVAVTRNGATMADGGSVQRLFERKGVVVVSANQDDRTITEDDLLEATLEVDVEDIQENADDSFDVISEPNDMVSVRQAIQSFGLDYESADVEFVPSFTQLIDSVEEFEKLEKIIDALEDCDDVQNVYSNVEPGEAVIAKLQED